MNSPNIFVISIRRLSHRIGIFKKNNPHIPFKIIYGCDVKDLKKKSIIDSYEKKSKLKRGDIAALISHKMAWQYMVDHQIERAFFFEDDIIFSSHAHRLLKVNNFPDKFQLVKLETYNCDVFYSKKHDHEFNGIRLHKTLSGLGYGSAGYLLSISMARFLIGANENINAPIDHGMFGVFSIPISRGLVHQCIPALCIQEDQLAIRQNRQSIIQSDVSVRSLNYPNYLILSYRLLSKLRLTFMYRNLKPTLYFLLAAFRNKNLYFKRKRIPFLDQT
jgi:GR25 family glycosyltransferase involved in LPS biosynthesis